MKSRSLRWLTLDLRSRHFQMWMHWIKFATLVSRRAVKDSDLVAAQAHLEQFVDVFNSLDEFGPLKQTPNMHAVFHIVSDIRRFGPSFVYHCFGFERFNGVMGKIPNDGRKPQVTYMRQFRQRQCIVTAAHAATLSVTVEESKCIHSSNKGDLTQPVTDVELQQWRDLSSGRMKPTGAETLGINMLNETKPKRGKHHIDPVLREHLRRRVLDLYPDRKDAIGIPADMRKFKRLDICRETFGSSLWNGGKEQFILAWWPVTVQERNQNDLRRVCLLPGRVVYYFQVDLILCWTPLRQVTHTFAFCQWHPVDSFHADVQSFEDESSDSIVPVSVIVSDYLPVSSGANHFQVLTLPNQLNAWNPSAQAVPDDE
jgi:hypothetical protein